MDTHLIPVYDQIYIYLNFIQCNLDKEFVMKNVTDLHRGYT